MNTYEARAAREAQASGYGDQSYWDYLNRSAFENAEYFLATNHPELAASMFTRSLSEALVGNDGD